MSTYKAVIAEPSDHLGIRLTPPLMLNEELKTLDYFSCVPAHELGYLGPVSPNYPNTWVPMKHNSTDREGLDSRVRSHR